eukprot:gene19278-26295_t
MYALKVMDIAYLVKKRQTINIKRERSILGCISHPNIVCMHMAFRTSDKLGFFLDYCAGGDLYIHIQH